MVRLPRFNCTDCGKKLEFEEIYALSGEYVYDREYGPYTTNARFCEKCYNSRLGIGLTSIKEESKAISQGVSKPLAEETIVTKPSTNEYKAGYPYPKSGSLWTEEEEEKLINLFDNAIEEISKQKKVVVIVRMFDNAIWAISRAMERSPLGITTRLIKLEKMDTKTYPFKF